MLVNTHEVPVAESLKNPDADLQVPRLLDKLRFVAGAEWVQIFDAQALAEEFLGDTIVANILALGFAWQRGLVPVSLEALQRAIELNAVAVPANLAAFALGRLAAGAPLALQALRAAPVAAPPAQEPIAARLTAQVQQLTVYQNTAWAGRFMAVMQAVQQREEALGGDASLPFTRAVAASLTKRMTYKDEYEVARLYAEPAFMQALHDQFEGEFSIEFHMAPPLLARPRNGQPPRKLRIGGWLLPVLKLLARAKGLRGTWADPFGHSAERRLERELIDQFEARVRELLPQLTSENILLAMQWAKLGLSMRGFGHVKLANITLARVREAELLHRFNPARYPRPEGAAQAGQLKGIAVVSA